MTTPVVFDTGASGGLSPYKSDFIDYEPVKIEVKGVAGMGQVIGRGTTLQKFTTRCGAKVCIPSPNSYHMPGADIRLESPQSIIRALGGGGSGLITGENIEWTLPDGRIIDIPIDHHTNLPLIRDSVCSSEEIKIHCDQVGRATTSIQTVDVTPIEVNKAEVKTHERNCARECCQCVADKSN